MNKRSCLFSLIFLFLLQGGLNAGIEAGAAAVEITPPAGLKMAGYSARKELSKGVMDPLFVRVFVLRSSGRSVGFVVYDLIDTFNRSINEELTANIRRATGIDEVIFIAIHTHSGPAIKTAENIESLPEYAREICVKTVLAMYHAWESLEPVRLGVGYGTVDLNYNRIKELPDGPIKMIWENPGKAPLGPVEQTVCVVKMDNLKGQTRVLLVNYACHPVILGSDNLLYSPDYPGAMRREVQDSHPDKPLCIFINGACGDMNPYFADENDRPAERVREVGRELAREVIGVAGSIVTEQDTSAINISWKTIYFPARGRWDLEKWGSEAEDENTQEKIEKLSGKMQNLNLPLSLVLITPEIGFVGLPGEFFSSFQSMLREKSPLKHLIVAGYTNGDFSYFPTIQAAVLGGYGANDEATYVRPGTGEHLVIEALVGLNELLGRLRPVPSSGSAGYRD